MKKDFFTGLALLLPVAVTFLLVAFIVNILAKPLRGTMENVLEHYHVFKNPFLWRFFSKLLSLCIVISVLVLIGFLTRLIAANFIINWTNALMNRIPMINKLYQAIHDVVYTLLGHSSMGFKQVVLVPFPDDCSFSLAFIPENAQANNGDLAVFIPGSPYPLMGFLTYYPKQDLIYLDMTVEDALKYVISCGIIYSNFKSVRL